VQAEAALEDDDLAHWKKVGYSAFFGTSAAFPAAKRATFAACAPPSAV